MLANSYQSYSKKFRVFRITCTVSFDLSSPSHFKIYTVMSLAVTPINFIMLSIFLGFSDLDSS